ncbi:hypothetical protein NE237_016146 [Protea cynaroides]|uniref:Uncharacterized protein n=1 Tax=Protea cynaroides TaxID=273540 RepID=A0A9Q0QRL4_9MAGN|nr:hypothetical protein NE237_016146 [Protea cynaroides]
MFDWSDWKRHIEQSSTRWQSRPAVCSISSSPDFGKPLSSSFPGSFRVNLKCATCGGLEWVPQITQPAFASNLFGSAQLFGGSSQPASGDFKLSPFGGATSSPTFAPTIASTNGTASALSCVSASRTVKSPTFGQSSTPAFGSSGAPCFRLSSSPAAFSPVKSNPFGPSLSHYQAQSSPLGTLRINLKCATCGGLELVPQITQPAVGGSIPFGSTQAFGGSKPTFGRTHSPEFGGATSNPTFGSTTTSTYGSTGTALILSSTSTSGVVNNTIFGPPSTPASGSSSASSFSISCQEHSIWT